MIHHVQIPQNSVLLDADLGTLKPLCSQSVALVDTAQAEWPQSWTLEWQFSHQCPASQPCFMQSSNLDLRVSQCRVVIGSKVCSMYCVCTSHSTHIIAPALPPARFFVSCFCTMATGGVLTTLSEEGLAEKIRYTFRVPRPSVVLTQYLRIGTDQRAYWPCSTSCTLHTLSALHSTH